MIWLRYTDATGNIVYDAFRNVDSGLKTKSRIFEDETGKLEITTDEKDFINSNRLFGKLVPKINQIFQELRSDFRHQIEAQTHELVGLQTHLSQKIEQIIDKPTKVRGVNHINQIEAVKNKIESDTTKAAEVLLYLDKRIDELEAHITSFQILHMGEYVKTNKIAHNVINLIVNIWHVFDNQFSERKINYIINFDGKLAETNKICLDYKTINAGFYNFFDNLVKYALPNSDVTFDFVVSNSKEFKLLIKMSSLLIEDDEKEKIFEFGYRSKNCKTKDGLGIGLCVMKKSMEVNNLKIKVETDNQDLFTYDGLKYSKNTFVINGRTT